MHLLIADASSTVRRTISNALIRAGIGGLMEADRGQHALALMGRTPISVFVVGSNLEDMQGTQFARHVRGLPNYRRAPLLMVSERRSHEDVLEAVDCGVDHYILIPFPEELLVDKVQRAMEKAAALAAAAATARRASIQHLYLHRS